jgi:protein TonB
MTGGCYQPKRLSPPAIAVVVLLHGAALTALLMAKMDMPLKPDIIRTIVYPVKNPPPPPPHTIKQPPKDPTHEVIDWTHPLVTHPDIYPPPPPPPTGPPPSTGTATDGPIAPPPSPPPPRLASIRTDPILDSRSALQPPYPTAKERDGIEGNVAVRVLIGTDGRVKSVEKISATDEDFFVATQRHALRNWRFRPATLDGRPVESSKVLTVRFQLNG